MKEIQSSGLQKWVNILLLFSLSVVIMYYAKTFFVPLIIGGLLALLLIPFCRWLERKGINRGIASFIGVITLAAVVSGIIALLSWQLSGMGNDLGMIQQNLTKQISRLQQYLASNLGISKEQQSKFFNDQREQSGKNISGTITSFIAGILGIATQTILVLVYMFLFIYSRLRIKNFILRLVPPKDEDDTQDVLTQTSKVVQQYLAGMGLMIFSLWVMYGIGFSIIGVKYALFFAVLCGILEIIPFVGNLTGTIITVIMSLTQGADGGLIVAIFITYAVVQLIQTYVLEPLVVGSQVRINPLFIIIALIAGELVWGIGGMVLAIPLVGVCKIICQHVETLKPYAMLIGNEEPKPTKVVLKNKKTGKNAN